MYRIDSAVSGRVFFSSFCRTAVIAVAFASLPALAEGTSSSLQTAPEVELEQIASELRLSVDEVALVYPVLLAHRDAVHDEIADIPAGYRLPVTDYQSAIRHGFSARRALREVFGARKARRVIRRANLLMMPIARRPSSLYPGPHRRAHAPSNTSSNPGNAALFWGLWDANAYGIANGTVSP